jgi:hypothetical protein
MIAEALVALSIAAPATEHGAHVSATSPRRCKTRACHSRVWRKHRRAVVEPYKPWLHSTGSCESGNVRPDPWTANTGNGFFGRFQFDASSWRLAGGKGLPHQASHLEQEYRAVRWLKIAGRNAWPVCG